MADGRTSSTTREPCMSHWRTFSVVCIVSRVFASPTYREPGHVVDAQDGPWLDSGEEKHLRRKAELGAKGVERREVRGNEAVRVAERRRRREGDRAVEERRLADVGARRDRRAEGQRRRGVRRRRAGALERAARREGRGRVGEAPRGRGRLGRARELGREGGRRTDLAWTCVSATRCHDSLEARTKLEAPALRAVYAPITRPHESAGQDAGPSTWTSSLPTQGPHTRCEQSSVDRRVVALQLAQRGSTASSAVTLESC